MSDPSNPLRLEVVGVLRNGRRRYDPASKRRLVEACLQPGVSLAGVAMRHGVNANLLRKWVTGQQQRQRNGVAVGAIERATDVFVPVVELRGVAGL
jgi:transposase